MVLDPPRPHWISIHALLTEGDLDCGDIAAPEGISIHALLTEGDDCPPGYCHDYYNFNPRPPHGGRPGVSVGYSVSSWISIHALLTEGDLGV